MENWPLYTCGIAWTLWFAYWTIAARGASESRWKEGFLARAQHLVPAVVAIGMIFWTPKRYAVPVLPEFLGWPGFAIVALGLGFSVWARVHLGKHWSGTITLKVGHELIRTGPYKRIRHPIYTGIISGTLGAAIAQGAWTGLAGFALMTAAFSMKLRREEKLLREQFGAKYEEYRRESWALFPWIF